MNSGKTIRFLSIRRAIGIVLLGVLFLFSAPADAQTQKGDKPAKNQRQKRELRFKTRSKQGDKARTKDVAGRRIRTKESSSANRAAAQYPAPKSAKAARARGGDGRAGKPLSPIFSSSPRNNQRAWKGGPYGARLNARPPAARNQNVFSNKSQLDLLKRMQRPPGDQGGGKTKVTPRSSSRAYMARRSVNPMARFIKKSKQGEAAYMTDPAGRKLRAKNYQTPRQPVLPAGDVYHGRKRVGDRPYRGPAGGSITSPPRGAPRAWKGDVSGRRIRGRNHQSKVQTGGSNPGRMQASDPVFGDRQKHTRKKGPSLFGRGSKPAAKGIGGITIRTKDNTIDHRNAGKSRSGNRWNNQGNPLQGKPPAGESARAANFQGNAKYKRPLTSKNAGKSRSGTLWNNNGQPVQGKPPGGESARAANFQGNAKFKRPLTPRNAGKSKSGIMWNNEGKPLQGKPPAGESTRAANFQGNVKGGRPLKPKNAGESRSGKLWNNDEKPILGRPPSNDSRRAAAYQGNVKGGRPDKPKNAGGSRSGKLWNNDETPIKVTPPSLEQLANYRYKGDIRMSRFRRNYIRNPNAAETSLKKARPDKSVYKVDDVPRQVKQYQYVRNPSSSQDALKVRTPGKAFARASDYQGNIRMKKFDWLTRDDFHPDAKFIKINRNNVDGEKDALTGFRLWWAKTFKKNDNQPDHLKEKIRKPRYDKGEQGLWYE